MRVSRSPLGLTGKYTSRSVEAVQHQLSLKILQTKRGKKDRKRDNKKEKKKVVMSKRHLCSRKS